MVSASCQHRKCSPENHSFFSAEEPLKDQSSPRKCFPTSADRHSVSRIILILVAERLLRLIALQVGPEWLPRSRLPPQPVLQPVSPLRVIPGSWRCAVCHWSRPGDTE